MSGHSKWSTIKHKKAVADQSRAKIFSKLSKAISIAVKTGGDPNPENNSKLRMVVDTAKSANMPKANIERAIANASKEGVSFEELTYEGFGPGGIAVMVEATTDNRNRTAQDIKQLFERGEGSLGGLGAVSFNFSPSGFLFVKKNGDQSKLISKIIDWGAEDFTEVEDGLEIFTKQSKLSEIRKSLEENNYQVELSELVQKPKNLQAITNENLAKKIVKFLESFNDHDDVQNVFTNADLQVEV